MSAASKACHIRSLVLRTAALRMSSFGWRAGKKKCAGRLFFGRLHAEIWTPWVCERESIGASSRDGDVTLELWWIRKLVKLKHEYCYKHPSCVVQVNDTYKKIYKVEPRESVKKHTRISKPLPRPTLWTQTTPWLTSRNRRRRTDLGASESLFGCFWCLFVSEQKRRGSRVKNVTLKLCVPVR